MSVDYRDQEAELTGILHKNKKIH